MLEISNVYVKAYRSTKILENTVPLFCYPQKMTEGLYNLFHKIPVDFLIKTSIEGELKFI